MSNEQALREALKALLVRHVDLVNSGDAGFWDAEAEPEVIAARQALALPTAAPVGEREAFERVMSFQFNYAESDLADKCAEGCPRAGEYRGQGLQDYYEVWQAARATLPTQQSAVDGLPVAWWIPKAEQFCLAKPSGERPFAKAWEPLYATAAVQQFKEDAERYRLLRTRVYIDPKESVLRIWDVILTTGATVPEMLDAAIDAAMRKDKP